MAVAVLVEPVHFWDVYESKLIVTFTPKLYLQELAVAFGIE